MLQEILVKAKLDARLLNQDQRQSQASIEPPPSMIHEDFSSSIVRLEKLQELLVLAWQAECMRISQKQKSCFNDPKWLS